MAGVARTMLGGAILVTVAYIVMCVVYVVGPQVSTQGVVAAQGLRAAPLVATPARGASPVLRLDAALVAAAPAASLAPCCESLQAALERAAPPSEPRMVLVTFCNAAFRGMLLNFAQHLRSARIPHVIGAVDKEAFALMQAVGSPTYLIDIGHVDGSSSHSGASWKKFAITRTAEVAKIVALGYAVIMTDVDVLWLRDPRPYLVRCDGPSVRQMERASCAQLLDADVMASSDNLSPGKNLAAGLGDAYWGTMNTGIVVIRPSDKGKAFATKWAAYVADGPGVYASLTSDQQVFNRLVREGPSPPNLHGRWVAPRPAMTLGTLPTMFFANGHGYFVHRIEKSYPGALPYAAHATYTYDGSSAAAKEQRFRDAGHWAVAEADDAARGTFLVVGGVELEALNPNGELGLGVHLEMLRHQLRALRDGLALAQALGRTLVLPHFRCYADKVWAGHDNVFVFQHMYPGAHADGNYMPFECPVDHVLQLSAWRKMGVPYRDARSAEPGGALANASTVAVQRAGAAAAALGAGVREVALARAALTDQTARAALGAAGSAAEGATVLKLLPSAQLTFCGFEDASLSRRFDEQFASLIRAIESWCSECHGQATAAALSRDALVALGRPLGETFERASDAVSLDQLRGAAGGAVGGGEELLVERVPRRADFWAAPPRQTVRLRVSVKGLATADVSGVMSPSLLFEDVPASLWEQASRGHALRKYSKCSDWIPPEVLALGAVHVIASRDEGQGTQFCAPYDKLLPPPLAATPAVECVAAIEARSS